MSWIEPDIALVPCPACGLLVARGALVRMTIDLNRRGLHWLPYHRDCVRDAPPEAAPWSQCAWCGETVPPELLDGAARWLRASVYPPRPPAPTPVERGGLAWRRVRAPGGRISIAPPQEPEDFFALVDRGLRMSFEVLHAGCLTPASDRDGRSGRGR